MAERHRREFRCKSTPSLRHRTPLTTSIDNLTGTAGNDTFKGVLSETGAGVVNGTVTIGDNIDGGAGVDTLEILNSVTTALPVGFATKNVENIVITNDKLTAVDASVFVGAQKIAIAKNATAVTVSNLNATTGLGVNGDAAAKVTGDFGAASISANLTLDGAKGAVDLVGAAVKTVNVSGSSLVTAAVTQLVTLAGTAIAGATVLNVAPSAALKLDISAAAAAETINVSGAGAADLGTLNAVAKTINASTNVGGVTATVANTKAVVTGGVGADVISIAGALVSGATINLGAGNDKLLSAGGSLSKDVVIDGGSGVDSIAVALINAGNASIFKNFEKVDLAGLNNDFDVALLTGSSITGLTMSAAPTGSKIISNLAVGAALEVSGAIAVNAQTTTINVTGAATNATDVFNVTFNGDAVAAVPAGANMLAGGLVLAGVETVNVVSGGAANTWNSITVTDNNLKSLVVTGAQNLDLAVTAQSLLTSALSLALTTVDGSAATGKLAITTNNNTGTFIGGSAADKFITGNQATTLTGNAGADNFIVGATVYAKASNGAATAYTPATAAITTITDFSKGDIITFADKGTETWVSTKVDISAATNLATALGIATDTAVANVNGNITWFQYAGNTYIVESTTDQSAVGAPTDAAATDVVVKLTGTIDLSTATFTQVGVGASSLTL